MVGHVRRRIENGHARPGANALAVHHIGSTAIPAIHAKPIIDLLVEVADIKSVDDFRPAMEASGYQVMGEYGIPGRRFFRKRDHAGVRTHHVHAFASGSPEINRHLAFRDFMIAHPEWAARYSDLKRNLAETCSGNIERYMDGKDALIQEVDARAAASS